MEVDWKESEGCAFHVEKICDMEWEHTHRQKKTRRPDLIAASSFGGPVAVLCFDEDDVSESNGEEDDWNGELRIYSSSGRLMHKKLWLEGKVAAWGWVRGGLLVCILESGDSAILFRGDNGASRIISLPSKGQQRIACAHVWAGGFVAVTEEYEVLEGVHLHSASKYRVRVRAKLSPVLFGNEIPRVVTVLRPFVSREEPATASIAVGNPSKAGVIVVDSDGSIRSQLALSDSVSISHFLVPHPSYRLIASYGVDGVVSLLPLDFCQVLLQHDCVSELDGMRVCSWKDYTPCSVTWCGMSTFALCVVWDRTPWSIGHNAGAMVVSMEHKFDLLSRAHLKGSQGLNERQSTNRKDSTSSGEIARPVNKQSAAHFAVPGVCHASFEVDGVRLIGWKKTSVLRQVPECYRGLFRLGSTEPGALLLDAVDMLDAGDADADESLKALVDNNKIEQAVETCLDAAEHAMGVDTMQMHLLRVASYGKRFFHLTNKGKESPKTRRRLARRFVDTCRFIKMCTHALQEVGIALTTRELRIMTPKVFVDRLLYHNHFFLASKLSKLASVSLTHVITHWATAKISASSGTPEDDDVLVAEISARVNKCQKEHGVAVPFAAVAAVAAAVGKTNLAIRLGDQDKKLSRRILLLLKVQDYEGALRALHGEVGVGVDPDLHMFVASDCAAALPWENIVKLCKENQKTFQLLSTYFRNTNQTQYKQLLLAMDKRFEKAMVLAEESCVVFDPRTRVKLMKEACTEFKDAGKKSLSALAAEQARLIERQNQLGDSVVGLSLANTVLDCIRRGMDDEAESFATEFGLNQRTYRRIQLRGLAARKAWSRIKELSLQQAVRHVLDDADFAETFVSGGQLDDAVLHIHQLDDSHEKKATLLVAVGLFEEALEAAYMVGNTSVLDAIRRRKPELSDRVKERLQSLANDGPPINLQKNGTGDRPAIFNVARDTCAQQ